MRLGAPSAPEVCCAKLMLLWRCFYLHCSTCSLALLLSEQIQLHVMLVAGLRLSFYLLRRQITYRRHDTQSAKEFINGIDRPILLSCRASNGQHSFEGGGKVPIVFADLAPAGCPATGKLLSSGGPLSPVSERLPPPGCAPASEPFSAASVSLSSAP